MAACPRCGSIARDRFLMHCFTERTAIHGRLRVLETSPRMGDGYRRMMGRFFDYTASDYDLSAHEGDIQIDLQAIALPDASIDILLTPHVLEHVPDTGRALHEIHRILRPGGRMYLQVPLLHGTTAVPTTPEFHADNTPVFFNFGWDLLASLHRAGFTTLALVTAEWQAMIAGALDAPASTGDGFDVVSLVSGAREHLDITRDLVSVIDLERSQRYGFSPPHHFMTWECVK
ncbi:MAG: class I SAM-dependent methyltransferase [Ilumatobacteraceae bacterium]